VIIGLRPADVTLTQPGRGGIDGTVYSHEMVGREQQIVIATGGDEIRCRLKVPIQVTVGTKVGLTLSLSEAKLFDAKSGQAFAARQ